MEQWYGKAVEDVLAELKTSVEGLSQNEAASRIDKHGANKLDEGETRSRLSIFLGQFKDVMIIILFAAVIVSFLVGETTDAFVILAIILGNAIIGYIQEYNAEQSMRMLQQMAAQEATVMRDGSPRTLDVQKIVPGDIVLLEAGDIVPADARLVEVFGLKTEEAALTGESNSIDKVINPIKEENLSPGDQLNMVFKGTIVSNGSGKAVVVGTGMETEMGKIAGMLQQESQQTPLQKRLARFSKQLAVVVVIICAIVFGLGMLRGEPATTMFLTALSLAVAALPEALPAVITIALARGAARMVKQHALVRRLPAVETLGSVTYICSDKTGTLTLNKMTVDKTQVMDDEETLLLQAMALNHEVRTDKDGKLLGDSTETAMVAYAEEKGYSIEYAQETLPVEYKLPFDSERMRMSTLHRKGDKWLLLVKGAPVKILELVEGYDEQTKDDWLQLNRDWAAHGLRVLFFGYKELNSRPEKLDHSLEEGIKMLGVVGMIDPPREEVIDAMATCKKAGIKTVMITGDQPMTARAIAEQLQMIAPGEGEVLTGADLLKLDKEGLRNKVIDARVYARVTPGQKLDIVEALQDKGQFVAMTGDGVNDAPSLKKADIGIAMGITGTDVSKEAAHMILLDDNFTTIVKAVREGRRIYENVRKFVLYILACNLGEILAILMAPFLGLPIPLLPIHILWINLVTDGLPGLALAAEKAEKNIMDQPPRPPQEHLFTGRLPYQIISTGIILAAAALFSQNWAMNNGYDLREQQTIVFTVLCFVQLMNALSVRSAYQSIFRISLFENPSLLGAVVLTIGLQLLIVYVPFFDEVFKTAPLDGAAMLQIGIVTLVSLVLIELMKMVYNKLMPVSRA